MNINVHFHVGQMEVNFGTTEENVEVQNTFLSNHPNVKYEKKLDNSKLGSTQHQKICCQDHILTENMWLVCSETS